MVVCRWTIRALLVGLASWFAWLVLVQSGDKRAYSPDGYLWPDLQYPVVSVIFTVSMIATEAFLVELLLHRGTQRDLWRRALPCGVAMVPLSVLAFSIVMDMPPYHAIHLVWIAVVNVMLLGLGTVSGAVRLVQVVMSWRR